MDEARETKKCIVEADDDDEAKACNVDTEDEDGDDVDDGDDGDDGSISLESKFVALVMAVTTLAF